MKKNYLIVGMIILIVIAFIYLLFSSQENQNIYKPAPVIQFQLPSPTPQASVSSENLSPASNIELQLKGDQQFAEEKKTILQKYPWFLTLPFQENGYFVYFDIHSETFVGKLYPQKTSTISLDEQINSLKNTVTEKISALGPDTGKYKIEWNITPE